MKTVKLTETELATTKAALHMQIQNIEKEIRRAKKDGKKYSAASRDQNRISTSVRSIIVCKKYIS